MAWAEAEAFLTLVVKFPKIYRVHRCQCIRAFLSERDKHSNLLHTILNDTKKFFITFALFKQKKC
jgi:hypothetical protein